MPPTGPLSRPTSPAVSQTALAESSYLDWPAIVAGSLMALAVSFILIGFGASIGLSIVSPYRGEGVSAAWLAIAAGLWFVWVIVSSFGAGGYLCGRMRRRAGDATADEVEVRDGAHGLTVWAVGALVGAVLAASGVTGLVGAGASAVGSAVGTTADVAAEAASSDYFADLLLRSGVEGPAPGATGGDDTAASADQDAGTAQSGDATGEAATDATAPSGAAGTTSASGSAGTAAAQGGMGTDPAVRSEIAGIIARSVTGGEIADRDRAYLIRLVSANTDLDPEAARARVEDVTAEIEDARDAALEAVEAARVTGVVLGFIATAALLLGAVAAFFAATAGGRHRDDGLGLEVLTARR